LNQTLIRFAIASLGIALTGVSLAAPVSGKVTEYPGKDGIVEQCIRIADFPGGVYSASDRATESDYCALDFAKLALCPKLWSTSPGTILYEFDEATYGPDPGAFESKHCGNGGHARDHALSEPAVYKQSVNARDTSATYAPASWVYYHFSRYFQTHTRVPVAVYRSMSLQEHNRRLVKPALEITAGKRSLRMLHAGWTFLDQVESGQLGGASAHALLTDEGRQIFGVLLNSVGRRYGAEFNGTRESGWGVGQNNDFQQTAPFLALRDPQPVRQAAEAAIRDARKNPRMAKDLPADTPLQQVVLWMQDVLEITLLDYILGQQDRIGNIDYNWRWYWIENGELQSMPASGSETPDTIAALKPWRLRQSAINDNDAGVRRGYADFAAKAHMLEGLRHYSPDLYRRLGRLAADFENSGQAFQWLTQSAGLSEREAGTIAERTAAAFALLQADCRSGALALDLEPARILSGTGPEETGASCDIDAP
jgi:hypothetical protein